MIGMQRAPLANNLDVAKQKTRIDEVSPLMYLPAHLAEHPFLLVTLVSGEKKKPPRWLSTLTSARLPPPSNPWPSAYIYSQEQTGGTWMPLKLLIEKVSTPPETYNTGKNADENGAYITVTDLYVPICIGHYSSVAIYIPLYHISQGIGNSFTNSSIL